VQARGAVQSFDVRSGRHPKVRTARDGALLLNNKLRRAIAALCRQRIVS
jgi:hypothetical protein